MTLAEKREQTRKRKLLVWNAAPFRMFGTCCDCRRQCDEQTKKALYVRGWQRRRLRCFVCFMRRPLSMPKALAEAQAA